MNVFVLDKSPVIAAQNQCDKHVVKMIVESGQMLSTAHRMLDGAAERRPSKSGKRMIPYWSLPGVLENVLYKAVHMNHPCTVWTMKSSENYVWHWRHLEALCKEYTYRYGKTHKTEKDLLEPLRAVPLSIPLGTLTDWPLAMGAAPECINPSDIVGSYRKFYHTKQSRFKMAWTTRAVPDWFNFADPA